MSEPVHPVYEKLLRCYGAIKERIPFVPKTALVLGSGLGDFGEHFQVEAAIPYEEIDGFPVSTVPGHKGRFLFAHVEGTPTVMMQGRVHYYEGYDISDVVLPIRLMKLMGAQMLFLTNAAGGLRPEFEGGALMMITDQIASFVPSPLRGANLDALGTRFPDMSQVYDPALQTLLQTVAKELDIPLSQGVYLQFSGPAYETPREVKMARLLGADAVGMSTACEAVAANHMGMRICGISCITNLGCGMTDRPLCHEEVQQTADRLAGQFRRLVAAAIGRMGKMAQEDGGSRAAKGPVTGYGEGQP